MRVLMISMDPKVADPESETRERLEFYKSALDKLSVIILESYGKSVLGKFFAFIRTWRKGRKELQKQDFDIITAQDPFGTGLIGYLLRLEFGIKLQLQIHTGLFTPYFWAESEKNRIFVRLARFLLPRADCIKTVSEGIRQYLVERLKINPAKISVLPVYTSFDKFLYGKISTNLRQKYPQFDFILLMACRLVKQKNIPLAIAAVGKLVKKYPKIGLVIVGSGPEEENLKQLTTNYELRTNVVFEPWTDDMVSYYKTADLFLLTSNYEGWARTILEAMAASLPSVMTGIYIGVAAEAVENGRNGIVVPVGDEGALAAVVEDMYLNREKLKAMGEAGRKTIENLPLRDLDEYLRRFKESFRPCRK